MQLLGFGSLGLLARSMVGCGMLEGFFLLLVIVPHTV